MRRASRLAALVVAAGCSSRAPGFKPLLPLGRSTVLENAIDSLRRAGISDITVVVGHRAAELMPVLDCLPVRPVVNERYHEGMFSSVVIGVRSLHPDTAAFFLLPADIPLVRSHTIRLLARAGSKTGADVVYPVFQGRRGHPPLISARLAPAILAWEGTGGLRPLLAKYEAGTCEMEVLDEGISLDIDTAADYRRIIDCHADRHVPSGNECDAILAKLAVPDAVRRHSLIVAGVAGRIASRLNRAGLALDEGLIVAAGLLHDVAKGRPNHPRCGAMALKRLGYPRVAAIVAVHHDIAFTEGLPLDEAAILYLADKLVQNERLVPVNERFDCSREKFAADAAAQAAVTERLAQTQRIAAKVEQTMGLTLGQVIEGDFHLQAGGESR